MKPKIGPKNLYTIILLGLKLLNILNTYNICFRYNDRLPTENM